MEDYTNLCILINAWDAYDPEYRESARSRFRELMLDMVDKGPNHLIRVFRLYMKTNKLDDESVDAFNKESFNYSTYIEE